MRQVQCFARMRASLQIDAMSGTGSMSGSVGHLVHAGVYSCKHAKAASAWKLSIEVALDFLYLARYLC
jgi:hypothetical protein